MTIERLKKILNKGSITYEEFCEINNRDNLKRCKDEGWFILIDGEIRPDVWIDFIDNCDTIECIIACEGVHHTYRDVSNWIQCEDGDDYYNDEADSLGYDEENEYYDALEGCWCTPSSLD